jgi:predicted DNA-binding transcriptional regulator AlpA
MGNPEVDATTTSINGVVRSKSKVARRHLTIPEVCEELDISRSTFYDWRAKRKAPPCFKLPNGDLRIRKADFESWLSSLEEKAA